jgi:hypothetical protein
VRYREPSKKIFLRRLAWSHSPNQVPKGEEKDNDLGAHFRMSPTTAQTKAFLRGLEPRKNAICFAYGVPSSMEERVPGGDTMSVQSRRDTPTISTPLSVQPDNRAIRQRVEPPSDLKEIIGSRWQKGKPIMYSLSMRDKVTVVTALTEGNNIRSIERVTGIHRRVAQPFALFAKAGAVTPRSGEHYRSAGSLRGLGRISGLAARLKPVPFPSTRGCAACRCGQECPGYTATGLFPRQPVFQGLA